MSEVPEVPSTGETKQDAANTVKINVKLRGLTLFCCTSPKRSSVGWLLRAGGEGQGAEGPRLWLSVRCFPGFVEGKIVGGHQYSG